jgi:integrase
MKLDSPTKRNRLKPRREPYWDVLGRGQAVGFRRGFDSWIARYRNEEGQQQYESIGQLKGFPPAEQFDEACRLARIWFAKCSGGMTEAITVSVACREYLEDLRLRRGPKAVETAKTKIVTHIEKPLGEKRVDKLSLDVLKRWRDKMVVVSGNPEAERASKNTANRVTKVLKAALNYSAKLHKIVDRTAWSDLPAFKGIEGVRDIYLSREEVDRLLEAATGALRALIRAGLLTGARLSELTGARVEDFDEKQGTLQVSGKTGGRNVVLSSAAIEFFRQQGSAKLPKAWLFPRDDGKPWHRDPLAKGFREAARKARLPEGTTYYSLRHWYISQALQAGMDIEMLARNVGNSAAIIRRHYFKFIQDDMRRQVEKLNISI